MDTANNDALYTIADLSRQFNLPESTCRYYCKRFAEFIPSVGEGRRKRFRKDTLGIIETIVEEMKKSRTCDAVEDVLAIRYPRTALVLQNENNILPTTQDEVQKNLTPTNSQAQLSTTDNLMFAQSFPPLVLEFMDRQTKALEGISKMFNVLISNISNIAQEKKDNSQIEDLKKEITEMKLLLDANEKNQQADLEQIRNWIGRIMKKICTAENKVQN